MHSEFSTELDFLDTREPGILKRAQFGISTNRGHSGVVRGEYTQMQAIETGQVLFCTSKDEIVSGGKF